MRTTLVSARRGALVLPVVLFALATAPAHGAGPAALGPPVLAGTPAVGETLTVSPGSWSPAPSALDYRWQRCAPGSYAAQVLADSPTAYYRLGDAAESDVVTDATGGEASGTFRNGVEQEVAGGAFEDSDGAAGFDGADDVVEVPDAPALDLGGAFTLEAWIRPGEARASVLLDKGAGGYLLALTASGGLALAASGGGTIVSSTEAVPADGAFHHVVATRSGSAARLFLDGVEVGGPVASRALSDTSLALLVGAPHDPAGGEAPFRGEIDEVALYRGALSPERVRAHYDAGAAGCVSIPGAAGPSYVLAAADHAATVRALVTATGAGGSTAAASEPTAVVEATVPVSVEPPVAWGEAVVGGELLAGEGAWAGAEPMTRSVRWQRCLDRGYRAAVLADGPSGYWRLGESGGTAAADDSGKGNRGTYANGVGLGAPGALAGSADPNTAARFDGVNDHVSVPDRSSLDLGDRLTLEAWVRRRVGGVKGQIVQKGVGGYALRIDPDDRVKLAKSNMGVVAESRVTVPADGAYHHVAATKDGAVARVYVDGLDVTVAGPSQALENTSAALQIGRFLNQNGVHAHYHAGELDEVAVYPRALTAAQVRRHVDVATSGCGDVEGATGSAYTPSEDDLGARLRVVVTAENAAGTAEAASAPTQAPVALESEPVIAAGTLTDAAGNPLAGATVTLHLWPADSADASVGEAAGTVLVAEATTDANGDYVLAGPVTPAIRAEADANGGVVNFELRATGNGLLYETFVERDFGPPSGDSLDLGGEGLEGAPALWQDAVAELPAAPARIALDEGEPNVSAEPTESAFADPPNTGVECSDHDIFFGIWKKTGQGEEYTRVGELHTWSKMTNRFYYGTRADSHIDVAFKVPGAKWKVNGSVHVRNATNRQTAAWIEASTDVGEYTSRAVRARFVYTYWYQCGTGNKKARAAKWNGYSLGKGVGVYSRDGECSDLKPWIYEPEQGWSRDKGKAVHWGAAVDLGFFVVGARSGYSKWVVSEWKFGKTVAARTLCGVTAYPDKAKRVFAGW